MTNPKVKVSKTVQQYERMMYHIWELINQTEILKKEINEWYEERLKNERNNK